MRSPPASPVLTVSRGSISNTWVSSSAFGQCSTPRGTKKVTLTYRRARFAGDVAVSGVVTFVPATSRVTGRLAVSGAMQGVLDVRATLWDPDRPRATVRGGLGGHRVALLAPAR